MTTATVVSGESVGVSHLIVATGNETYSGFPAVTLSAALTLYVVAAATFGTTGTITISASISGTTTTIATLTAATASTTYSTTIPAGTDLSTVQVVFRVVPDGLGGDGVIALNLYEIYIQ